jgi:CRISPR/Cas system CMR subunit Cmr6 (Cas7 group RAMP superfamily)
VPSDDQDPVPRDPLTKQVSGWLESALKTLGAGAKTAAGYGYFQSFRTDSLQKGVQLPISEPQ